jgi:hypothetical protein
VLSLVEVVLQLPEATEISLRARVVHVLNADQAASMGKPPGMGLELLDIDPERKRQVMQLIEFARWQGASGDPQSSFARTLLELSPSMPPAEVGYRLSMLPDAPKRRSESRTSIPQAAPERAPSGPIPQRAETAAAALRRSLTPPGGRAAVRESSVPRRPDSAPLGVGANATPRTRSSCPPQPTAAGRRASSVSLPAATTATTATTARSSVSTPAASTASSSASLPAEPSRTRGGSNGSLPAANGGERPSRVPEAPPAKPTDKLKLKTVLTHVAHKHYEEAIRAAREMLEDNPGDPAATLWQALSCARLALQRDDHDAAFTYYEQILRVDPEHREAREFVRTQQRDKKLNSIPFGRYFTTKKK